MDYQTPINPIDPVSDLSTSSAPSKILVFSIAIIILLAGAAFGFIIQRYSVKPAISGASTSASLIKTDKEIGSTDTKTFRDHTTGILKSGGIQGEGTHHLVLDSNPKNSAYLVSSVVDLDQFIDKHIEVWGETTKAAHAPWLMDVGRVKILQ